jgi:ATP-binding cassette subfamily B protein
VVALTLQQAGASVRGFSSCRELVAALEKALPASPPHLFLIDLAMPEEDGFQTLRRVRALEMAKGLEAQVPAVALTAFTQIERERLVAAGFRERVDKPVDVDKLIAVLRSLLAERRQAATS